MRAAEAAKPAALVFEVGSFWNADADPSVPPVQWDEAVTVEIPPKRKPGRPKKAKA